MLTVSSAMFAQKYAVIDANAKLTEACQNPAKIDMAKLNQAWEDIQKCMVHEKSKDYYDTWLTAAKIKNIMTVKVYQDGQASGQLDTLKYFNGLKDILSYYSTYEKCMTTPNEKGKLPMDEEDYKKAHILAQTTAKGLRMNILSGAYSFIKSHPQQATEFLDIYIKSFDDPLFKELNLNETDTLKENAYLYYGMALKSMAKTPADTAKYLSWYVKVLDSKLYGNYACVELMNTYKLHKDMVNWEKYCRYAIDNYKSDPQFSKLLIQEFVNSGKKQEALKACDQMAQNYPDEIFPLETKALIIFNDKKYTEAIDAFKKLTVIDPDYARAWCSLGTCYYQLAMQNRTKIDVCKKYLNLALPCYKSAEKSEPDDPTLWGNYLYSCYHALSDKVNEAKYKKYDK